MEKQREETYQEYLARLAEVAKTLTPEQIEACAWVMGASGCGWTSEKISQALLH